MGMGNAGGLGSLLSLLIPLFALLVTFAWGMFLGTKRSFVRLICGIGCFALSLIFAFSVKNMQTVELMELLKPYLDGVNHDAAEFIMNESIHDVVSACGGALLSPLAFLVAYVVLSLLVWIVCHIFFLLGALFGKKGDSVVFDDENGLAFHSDANGFNIYGAEDDFEEPKRARTKRSFPVIILCAAVQVLLATFVVMTPVVAYLDCIPNVVTVLAEVDVLSKVSEDANELTADKINQAVDGANATPLVVAYRAVGGNAMCQSLTTIDVAGVHTDLGHEMAAIAKFSTDIYLLYGQDIKGYEEAEVELLRGIDESMHESVFLPVVAGELIYSITEVWLDENGTQEFMGMNKPLYQDATTEMVTEPFDLLLKTFNKDARDVDALVADFETVERIVEILVHDGVFKSMSGDTTNGLVKILSGGTTVKSLLTELEKNPSFADLAKSIKKIGMRAVVSSIKMEAADLEQGEQYVKEYSDEAANAINEFNADKNLSREEKKEKLTDTLKENYATKTGKDMELEDEVVGIYADVLLDEFGDKENVTAEEVEAFFNAYAGIESAGSAGTDDGIPENAD